MENHSVLQSFSFEGPMEKWWDCGGENAYRHAVPCGQPAYNDISSRFWINKPHVLPFQLLIATPRLTPEAENDNF